MANRTSGNGRIGADIRTGGRPMNGFLAILQRDLRLALRQGADSVMVVAFFIVTTTLFPFGVGPEANILARIASGVIWVSALLAAMLSLERVFQTDYEDGTLELLTLSPVSLELLVLGKVCAHWLTTGLPLIIAAPIAPIRLRAGVPSSMASIRVTNPS
eukprot:NODE_5224_length_716_cov_1.140917_g5201_i0.p1 GENE.NODE_5224_length_716_cov_1.140917_g5201_i0~~NODE_5224_length_716_cov_1.140917_g5201_i0.p1  ORF type:complete len:159 (+),score=5.06 NODE_5224_length_716_cov_1.140917_g5201_i0:213-689(+)